MNIKELEEIFEEIKDGLIKLKSKLVEEKEPPTYRYYKNGYNYEFEEAVKSTEYLVRGNDTVDLWQTWHQVYGYSWEQRSMGWCECIGYINGMPLMISTKWNKIGGKWICFYYPTGWVNDWRIVDEWREKKFPGIKETNIMNFHIAMNNLGVERPPDTDARVKKHMKCLRELEQGIVT